MLKTSNCRQFLLQTDPKISQINKWRSGDKRLSARSDCVFTGTLLWRMEKVASTIFGAASTHEAIGHTNSYCGVYTNRA